MLPRKRINTGENNIIPMKGRALLCIVLGLLAVTPALAPASERAGETSKGTPEGWSDEINLSETSQMHLSPNIAVNQDNLHVVWYYDRGPTSDILYRKSTDGGRTWGQKITLGSSTLAVTEPDIALSNENIHVVWCDYQNYPKVYYRNSTDNGETWNPQRQMTPVGLNSYSPRIYVNNSNVHIFWYDERDGSDGEIYYRRSLNGGITFDNGQGLDEDRRITFSPASIGGPWVGGDGSNISIVWYDERGGNWQVYWMISKDNGFTWEDGLGTPNVGRKISNSVDASSSPSIAVDSSDIYIVWSEQHWPGPEYRLYYRNSTDMGVTWGNIQLLSGPTPLINNADIDASGDNISIVWNDRRDDGTHEQIYYKNSTDGGASWNEDLQLTFNLTEKSDCPKIAVQNDTIHVVWHKLYSSSLRDVFYKRSPDFPIPSYTISLRQGWNLLSTPLIPSDGIVDKVLENITGKWDYIQLYNSTDPDHWKTNLTYRPEQLNDLSSLDYRMGFWINVTEPGVFLTLKGQIPKNTVIPLYAGWNLVGYPTLNDTMTVGNALWGTGADRVQVFDAADPYRLKDVTSTYIMKPGEGYWVHVVADSVWVVDW
jgi:hypothetical protein